MNTYISLLRGINVAGQKKIPMDRLRALYASLGYSAVTTYLHSGNVLFATSNGTPTSIAHTVEKAIRACFGFEVAVVARRSSDFARVIRGCPFAPSPRLDESRIGIVFLKTRPSAALVRHLCSLPLHSADTFEMSETEIYLSCGAGFGTTVLTTAFFEKHLNTVGTMRNLRTVRALLELSRHDTR